MSSEDGDGVQFRISIEYIEFDESSSCDGKSLAMLLIMSNEALKLPQGQQCIDRHRIIGLEEQSSTPEAWIEIS